MYTYSIYIEKLNQIDSNFNRHDAGSNKILEWSTEQIRQAMIPIVSVLNSFRSAAEVAIPDEIEFTMQFELGLKGEVPVLKIVSTESSAQIAVKFKWKNNDN